MLLMKDIIDDSNKLIRSISKEVSLPLSKEDHDLLMDMHAFLVASQDEKLSEKYDLRPAVGIAAIQLGIPKRMCAIHVLDFDENGEKTVISHAVETKVSVNPMSTEEIQKYIESKEPMDKAGAYGIQGRFSAFIEKIEGDYFNVVGLPVSYVYQVLKELGEV